MHGSGAILLGLITLSFANVIDLRISVDEDVSALDNNEHAAANCYWSGTSPFCAGGCDSGYEDCRTSSCGDGACCVTGYKKYCCKGGCATSHDNKLSDGVKHGAAVSAHHHDDNRHQTGGGHDDYCPEGEFICCPLRARKNEECMCLPKEEARGGSKRPAAVRSSSLEGLQRTFGDPDNDFCDPSERICCPPDATENSQCTCYKP